MKAENTGRIFDIQKFSIHDGPGIRTIVFFKGCLFRCPWCCNPESQEFEIQTMKTADGMKTIGRDVTVEEVLEEVAKDRAYYRRGGGGLTLSGGECMCQPEFAYALLKAARERGINTAIETTAAVPWEMAKPVILETDYVLMDIKHMDSAKHRAFIGKDNKQSLENAWRIAEMAEHFTVRVPVVPTFNDTEAEIREIAKFVKTLPGDIGLHLLPYHRLGRDKYTGLDREYKLEAISPPKEEQMERLLQAALSTGVKHVQIGG